MQAPRFILAVFIHFVVPALGVLAYLLLRRKMRHANIPSPPNGPYFVLFSVYGAWLVVVLASIFGMWSGMASIGTLGLILVAPFALLGVGMTLHDQRLLSVYHWRAYVACAVYVLFVIAMFAIIGVAESLKD
jgi:hypothetical protein